VLLANQPIGNYWVRALPNIGRNGLSTTFSNGVNSAILRYAGAPAVEPITSQTANPVNLLETDLHPLNLPAAPGIPIRGAADVNLRFELGFRQGEFTVNGSSYKAPSVPVLLQMISGARQPGELLPAESIYFLPRNKVVEVTIPGLALAGPVRLASS